MPHIDITMIPGRDEKSKERIARRIQQFLSEELEIDEKFVSVSIEDITKENWEKHMDELTDKVMYVKPGV